MVLNLSINTGESAYVDSDAVLSDLTFGARYTTYTDIDRFLDQINDLNIGLIVWPGGTMAETETDRFGLGIEDLYQAPNGRPGLSDMLAIAVEQGTAFSLILPTARYVGDEEGLRADIQSFLGDLLGGAFGPLPDTMILEVGSEYYANFEGSSQEAAADYGALADIMVTEVALALGDTSVNTLGADLVVAVQAGKTLADDVAIRAELSDFALSETDTIIHHRFAFDPQGIDGRIDELEQITAAWASDAETIGGDAPDLFVSAWNTVSLTRKEVLDDFISERADAGETIAAGDVDLTGRTNVAFEEYWQEALEGPSYGQSHAAYLLEGFASYAEAGMDMGAVYGVDLVHAGRISWRDEDGMDHRFVGGELLDMLHESVEGTHVLSSDHDYDRTDPATIYGFENEDKLVLFIAAGGTPPGEVALSIAGLGSDYLGVWGESLTSEVPEDWMAMFGILDNPDVDESAEGETYRLPVREGIVPVRDGNDLLLDLDTSHQIIRLAFAKTEAGAAEIAGWAEGAGFDLTDDDLLPTLPPVPEAASDEVDDEPDSDLALLADAASGGGMLGLFLMLVFLL
jgi:hypothetical protein